MNAMQLSLKLATDEALAEELLDRGLVVGVTTRDLVELMHSVQHRDTQRTVELVRMLSRVHLGKII